MGKDQVADAVAYFDEMVKEYQEIKAHKLSGELCSVCEAPLYTDPGSHEVSLFPPFISVFDFSFFVSFLVEES